MLVTGRAGDLRGDELPPLARRHREPHGPPRLALHAFYCRWDKPQQQYQKALLRPETQARCRRPPASLLALDDPANDALSAEGGRSGFMK